MDMIDIHCHILPGVDDGAADLSTALAMARMAVEDGVRTIVCTPHIMPGVYDNRPADIRAAVKRFAEACGEAGLSLQLLAGSDAHIRPDFVAALNTDRVQTIGGGRYVLFEPPHTVAPPRLEESLFDISVSGWVPILTHPERFAWMEERYDILPGLVEAGVLMQVTAGSLVGVFGEGPRRLAERMLEDGLVHVVASDGHNTRRRNPRLAAAYERCRELMGDEEARHLVATRPAVVVADEPVAAMPPLPPRRRPSKRRGGGDGLIRRLKVLFGARR
jgi:protein-tyrosine phosphatase